MWQEVYEKYGSDEFTVVGIAMDSEGVAPAKKQYDRFGVTFNALVDPNYATRFEYVPWLFFVDEHGVVQDGDWAEKIKTMGKIKPVTEEIRNQWTPESQRNSLEALASLVRQHEASPDDLSIASELASRYITLDRLEEARNLLRPLVKKYDALEIARSDNRSQKIALADAYIQLSRAETEREAQVEASTLAYYVYPTKGYVKQVVRIKGPAYFDNTEDGKMDSKFRSSNIDKLVEERSRWLKSGN